MVDSISGANFVLFDRVTGGIRAVGHCPPGLIEYQATDSFGVIAGFANEQDHFVDVSTGEIRNKPHMPIICSSLSVKAYGAQTVIISEIPAASTVMIDCAKNDISHEIVVEDGTLELSFDAPGDYRVSVRHLHAIPYEVTINAFKC